MMAACGITRWWDFDGAIQRIDRILPRALTMAESYSVFDLEILDTGPNSYPPWVAKLDPR